MEAPEKIYIHESQYWGLMANRHDITKKVLNMSARMPLLKRHKILFTQH